jgi:hypothetical protein
VASRAVGADSPTWDAVNAVASGLRMPLFFTISGLLATKWISADWPTLLSMKVTLLFGVYLIWQPVDLLASLLANRFTGFQQTLPHLDPGTAAGLPGGPHAADLPGAHPAAGAAGLGAERALPRHLRARARVWGSASRSALRRLPAYEQASRRFVPLADVTSTATTAVIAGRSRVGLTWGGASFVGGSTVCRPQ